MSSPLASPETEPFPTPPLAHLLHICLLNPTLLLPSHFRAALLAPVNLNPHEGALEPLYKHLANTLLTCTETNSPSGRVFELVATLKEEMRCLKFRIHVQEPFFSQLKAGSKTIEGRCAIGAYNSILPGDVLLVNNVLAQVVKMVSHYNSFDEMLRAEGLDQILPGVTSFAEGVAIYRQFYSEEEECLGGVLAIHVKNVSEERQPLTMVRIILEAMVFAGCLWHFHMLWKRLLLRKS